MNTEKMVQELRSLQALIEEAQAEAEALKDALKAMMGGAEEMTAGAYKVTWKPVTSDRVDIKALKADRPEVAAAYTKKTTVRRFSVGVA